MKEKSIGIIGDGNMGWQIATISALSGYSVLIQGRKEKKINFEKKAARLCATGSKELKIKYSNNIKDILEYPIIIETISEEIENKKQIFNYLEKNSPFSIICTNTSSIDPNLLITNREKICMLHFMNPISSLNFVEFACFPEFEKNIDIIKNFVEDIKFEFIQIKPIGGLVANRVLFSYLNTVEILSKYGIEEELTDKIFNLLMGSDMKSKKIKKIIGSNVYTKIMKNFKEQNIISD